MEIQEFKEEIEIPVGTITLRGHIMIPHGAASIVVFVHGSGSSRHSARNKLVAELLYQAGFGILLFDLLTLEEDRDGTKRFDIDFLTKRLIEVTEWLSTDKRTTGLGIGYFGASTGAAAALEAAADLGDKIKAVVSRGGRPDLAAHKIPLVKAPTLLIVGSLDYEVIGLNELAFNLLNTKKKIAIVEDAGHLFEEPGKLGEVAVIAREWFQKHLV